MNKEFLLKLLNISSPSGEEHRIQRVWMDYMKEYVDSVEADNIGNVYAKLGPQDGFKIMIAAHADEIGFMVRKVDERGYIYLEKAGGISPLPTLGMKVKIDERIIGIVGVNAEHHGGSKGERKITDVFVDCGFKDKQHAMENISIGDMVVYDIEPLELVDGKIASKALDDKTGLFIMSEVMKRLAKEEVSIGVIAASTVNEETNMGGAYFAGSKIKPDMAIALDVTFSGDYTGADDIEIELSKGPVVAKGAPINRRIAELLEDTARKVNIGLQYELTPKNTGTDADGIRKTGEGVPVALVSLPIRYMHAPYEVCSIKDIEDEIELLVATIKGLSSNFNLCPID